MSHLVGPPHVMSKPCRFAYVNVNQSQEVGYLLPELGIPSTLCRPASTLSSSVNSPELNKSLDHRTSLWKSIPGLFLILLLAPTRHWILFSGHTVWFTSYPVPHVTSKDTCTGTQTVRLAVLHYRYRFLSDGLPTP
jgi:hypothetical protein